MSGAIPNNHELRRTIRGFFVSGVDTTVALMLHTLHNLLSRPEMLEEVKTDRSLLNLAIEAKLRFKSPAIGMIRGTTPPLK